MLLSETTSLAYKVDTVMHNLSTTCAGDMSDVQMKEGRQTVVICGFGELGQTIANMLEVSSLPHPVHRACTQCLASTMTFRTFLLAWTLHRDTSRICQG